MSRNLNPTLVNNRRAKLSAHNQPSLKHSKFNEMPPISRRAFIQGGLVSVAAAAPILDLSRISIWRSNKNKGVQKEPIKNLPVAEYREQICQSIENSLVTLIMAETGAGKSTQVPQYLAELGYKGNVVQPRRFATESLAKFVKQQYAQGPDRVGYKHALHTEDCSNKDIIFSTDGYFLQMLKSIKSYGKNDIVILDEVHEYSQAMEAIIAIMSEKLQQGTAPRLVLMSATMQAKELQEYFAKHESALPLIEVPGRTHGITELTAERTIEHSILREVSQGRNVLVFLYGKGPIEEMQHNLEHLNIDAEILPLHSKMSSDEQDLVHRQYDRPKIVLATPIAETSVTIDDIDTVIISGQVRRKTLVDGIETLKLEPVTKRRYLQQKGRVGRTKPGYVINHGVPEKCLSDEQHPSIQNSALDNLFLRLLAAGYEHPQNMPFLHRPSKFNMVLAMSKLLAMGAVDDSLKITKSGLYMAHLPLDPRPAKLVFLAEKFRKTQPALLEAAIDIAAIYQTEGLFDRSKDRKSAIFQSPDFKQQAALSDLLGQLYLFHEISSFADLGENLRNVLAEEYNLDQKALTQMLEYRAELRRRLKLPPSIETANLTIQNYSTLHRLILDTWADLIHVKDNRSSFQKGPGRRTVEYRPVISNESRKQRQYSEGDRDRRRGFMLNNTSLVRGNWVAGDLLRIEHLTDLGEVRTTQLIQWATAVPDEWIQSNLGHELWEGKEQNFKSRQDLQRLKRRRAKGPHRHKRLPNGPSLN